MTPDATDSPAPAAQPSPSEEPLPVTLTVEQLWQPFPGGSGTYVSELASALAARQDVALDGLAARHRHGVPGLPADMRVRQVPLPRVALYETWSRRALRPVAPGRAVRGGVMHATTWAVPPARGPLVVTVHDVAFLRDPDHFTPRGTAFFRRGLEIVRRDADVVVVPSAATADDLAQHGVDPDRVRVIPHGVSVPTVTTEEKDRARSRHGLARPYVLWVGTVEPRKNVARLVEAYRDLLAGGVDVDLVLAGPAGWGQASADVASRTAELPEGRVHLLGRLPLADLHAVYAGAAVLCFPSLWEGFGLPALEALAHGVPVVTSRGTSMAEVVTPDVSVLVEPTSVPEMAAGLAHALEHRDELAAGAREVAAGYTWELSAARHVAAYRDARQSRRRTSPQ